MAAIDIDNYTAFHLEEVQTIATKEQSLADWYADIISDYKEQILELFNTNQSMQKQTYSKAQSV